MKLNDYFVESEFPQNIHDFDDYELLITIQHFSLNTNISIIIDISVRMKEYEKKTLTIPASSDEIKPKIEEP